MRSAAQPFIERVAGGVDDEVGGELGAVLEDDCVFGQAEDLADVELDVAVGNQFRRANVDVVARAAPEVLHEQPRAVLAPVELEPDRFEAGIEVSIALPDRGIDRDLKLVQDPVGQRREDQVGLLGGDPGGHRLLGIGAPRRAMSINVLELTCGSMSADVVTFSTDRIDLAVHCGNRGAPRRVFRCCLGVQESVAGS